MDYHITETADRIDVALNGRMEFGDHLKFRALSAELETGPLKKIVLDLAHLDFVDSSGLGMLIVLRNLAERRKCGFAVRKPTEAVRRILETVHFTALAQIED